MGQSEFGPMRIVSLEVENVKRVRAVHIEPDGNVVVIGGGNAEGKSSVLDAMWMALASRKVTGASNPDPLRHGAESGRVSVDLGELRVTRTFGPDGATSLKVTARDGTGVKSPAKLLDGLVGAISFDPLEFVRMPPREQVAALLRVVQVDVDLEDLASRRQVLFDRRTDAGREARFAEQHAEKLPSPTVDPSWNLDGDALKAEMDAARTAATAVKDCNGIAERDWFRVQRAREALALAQTELEEATENWELAVNRLAAAEKDSAQHRTYDEIASDLAVIAERSELVRQKVEIEEARYDAQAARAEYDRLDAEVAALDQERRDAIARTVMPVDGLSFDDDGLTYNGVRIQQASMAEQLRVCTAIAIAANPTIRVVRISDGALLDATSMGLLEALAVEHDMQVWVERVGDADEQAVVIVDGEARP